MTRPTPTSAKRRLPQRYRPRQHRGFTLVEAVLAITVLGILGAIVATFLKAPIDAYVSQSNRAVLSDTADGALRRITRDIATALPNSLRSAGSGSSACVEFLPTLAAGRYRYQQSASLSGDVLDFAAADTSFDMLGQMRLGNLPAGTKRVAIYNLGIPGADAYAGDNTAVIASASTSSITLGAGKQFPFESPTRAFSVIPDYAVVYSCAGNKLYRSTQAISATPMSTCPASGVELASNVSACSFSYTAAVNERGGLLAMRLALTLQGETITLYDQVAVSNVP